MAKPAKRFHIDKEKVVWRTVDGEAVILNLDDGLYYTLNKTGSRMWEQVAEGKPTEEISCTIVAEFDSEPARVSEDLEELITQLKQAKLIEVAARRGATRVFAPGETPSYRHIR